MISIFTANIVGAFLWFKVAQFHNYNVQKQKLRTTRQYDILYLSMEDYKNYKVVGKKEIKIKNAMYDYEQIDTLANDTLKLYAVRDYKEEFLMLSYFKSAEKKHGDTSNKTAANWMRYMTQYYIVEMPIIIEADYPKDIFISFGSYQFSIIDSYLCGTFHPPKS